MTAEAQLYAALKRIVEERGKEFDVTDNVRIPLINGEELLLPIALIQDAP
jgi:hypothetical protein